MAKVNISVKAICACGEGYERALADADLTDTKPWAFLNDCLSTYHALGWSSQKDGTGLDKCNVCRQENEQNE